MEFVRKFYKDDAPNVWHYMPCLDSAQKPIPIEKAAEPQSDFWEKVFGKVPDVVSLEIGSGKGGFLLQYAAKHSEFHVMGCEWDASCAYYAARRLSKRAIQNAAIMRGDVFFFLRDCVPSNSVNEIHIYFPDPWPKRRQNKNRLILREGFLEQVHRILKAGNHLYWATDHKEYNDLALAAFRECKSAEIETENTAEPTDGIETNFEQKYKKEGRPIYRSVIRFT